ARARRRRGVPEAWAHQWLLVSVLLLPTAVLPTGQWGRLPLPLPGRPLLLPIPPGRRRPASCLRLPWNAVSPPCKQYALWGSRVGPSAILQGHTSTRQCHKDAKALFGVVEPPRDEIAPGFPLLSGGPADL